MIIIYGLFLNIYVSSPRFYISSRQIYENLNPDRYLSMLYGRCLDEFRFLKMNFENPEIEFQIS